MHLHGDLVRNREQRTSGGEQAELAPLDVALEQGNPLYIRRPQQFLLTDKGDAGRVGNFFLVMLARGVTADEMIEHLHAFSPAIEAR